MHKSFAHIFSSASLPPLNYEARVVGMKTPAKVAMKRIPRVGEVVSPYLNALSFNANATVSIFEAL